MNERLVPCSDCGKPISRRAAACPSCGGPVGSGDALTDAPKVEDSRSSDLNRSMSASVFGLWSQGRINRTTYGTCMLVLATAFFFWGASSQTLGLLSLLKTAVAVLRARDIGIPSWVTLLIAAVQAGCVLVADQQSELQVVVAGAILVVVLSGAVFVFALFFVPGARSANRYGPPPGRGFHMPWPVAAGALDVEVRRTEK